MKQINIDDFIKKNDLNITERLEVLGMEFIPIGEKYLVKGSNSVIVDEAEKLKLERNELILDNNDCDCKVEKIKKVSKINKKIKEIEKEKATKEVADDTIEETNSTL